MRIILIICMMAGVAGCGIGERSRFDPFWTIKVTAPAKEEQK